MISSKTVLATLSASEFCLNKITVINLIEYRLINITIILSILLYYYIKYSVDLIYDNF